MSGDGRARLHRLREKGAPVIPNPRCLRVRDLLFAKKPREKQIPHPVQKPNGFRNDIFRVFAQAVQPCRKSFPLIPALASEAPLLAATQTLSAPTQSPCVNGLQPLKKAFFFILGALSFLARLRPKGGTSPVGHSSGDRTMAWRFAVTYSRRYHLTVNGLCFPTVPPPAAPTEAVPSVSR
jgi:hypothetical protein